MGMTVHQSVEHRNTNHHHHHHLTKGEIPCGRVMALGGAAGEPVSSLALEEPSLFCIRRPVTKKNRRKKRTEEKNGRRRGEAPAPSASPVSFKSDKCAAGNMTEKNNAESSEASGLPKGPKNDGRERKEGVADWGSRNRKTNIRPRRPFVSYCFGRQTPRRLSLA